MHSNIAWSPSIIRDIERVEKVQRRLTKRHCLAWGVCRVHCIGYWDFWEVILLTSKLYSVNISRFIIGRAILPQ